MKFAFRAAPATDDPGSDVTPAIHRAIHGREGAREFGWLTNPKRELYNRVYSRTTFGIGDVI